MAITAAPGYIVDPSNPNAVIKDPGTSTSLGGMAGGSATYGATNVQPIASQPSNPTPLPTTPPAQQTYTTPSGARVTGGGQMVSAPTTQPQTQPQAGGLAMPASGSVVDLLNMAGQDSSQDARKRLAAQYGIQGYDFSAAKNKELADKFIAAYNTNKNQPVPQSGAQAASALDSYFQAEDKTPEQDPFRSFMDQFASMDPIQANIFQQLSTALSATTNQQSLTDFYKQEIAAQGIPELNMELADINRIMEGTEDDIRDEIGNAGGFVTESQVQALTTARNKGLLKKANYLSNVLQAKNEYVDRIVSLTQADREQVSKELDRKLGITETLFNMTTQMKNSARENYKMIVDSVGWEGLAQMTKGNKKQAESIERLFGLAPGDIQSLAKLKKPLTEKEQLDIENQRLQNQKLRGEIGAGPTVQTQVVEVGGKKLLINSKTGATISEIGGGDGKNMQQLALDQVSITDTNELLEDPGLNSAVGKSWLGRTPVADFFSGAKSTFVGKVQNLISDLTLDKLAQVKGEGVTFGALSDQERAAVAAAATKLNSPAWTVKDDVGNILGWKVPEDEFKKEIDTINYFKSMDFILQGGDPESIGVVTTQDGKMWYQNYDGSKTEIK